MQALFDCIAQLTPGPDAARLFHGRGGRYPGCEQSSLDSYPPALVLTSFTPLDAAVLERIDHALQTRYAALGLPLTWVYQERSAGQSACTQLMRGDLPEPHWVTEGESTAEGTAHYRVRLLHGQNHGLFLDMAAGRQWVGEHIASCASNRPAPAC